MQIEQLVVSVTSHDQASLIPHSHTKAQCLKNLTAVLEEAGSSLQNCVKVNVFLTDMKNFAAMNKVYDGFFNEPKPVRYTSYHWSRGGKYNDIVIQCRTCVAVHELPMRTDVEIECIAHL